MAFGFEELTPDVRRRAREELERELSAPPIYFSPRLSAIGKRQFYRHVGEALDFGNVESLEAALLDGRLWNETEEWTRDGTTRTRKVNHVANAKMMAITEFNTWYVRGLCSILLDAGIADCEVYRAGAAWEPRAECLEHDGRTYAVLDVYNGHRIRYWPEPGQREAFSIPVGPNCHHTIRRVP